MVVSCCTYLGTLTTTPSFSGPPSGQPVTYVTGCSYFLTTFLRLITRKKIIRENYSSDNSINFSSQNLLFNSGSQGQDRNFCAPHADSHTQAQVICRGLSEQPEVTCAPGVSCPEVSRLLGFAALLWGQHLLNSSPEAAVGLPSSPHPIWQGLASEDRSVTDA